MPDSTPNYLTTDDLGKVVAEFTGIINASLGSVIQAASIQGNLDADQIASVAAEAIQGQITETQIADNAITAPKIAAGSVTAGELDVAELSAITEDAGTINAGTIHGVQVNIDAPETTNPNTLPPNLNRVQWIRQTNGALAADVSSHHVNNTTAGLDDHVATFRATHTGSNRSAILRAVSGVDSGVGHASLSALIMSAAGTGSALQSAIVLDETGRSGFLKLATIADLSVNIGFVNVTFPTGGAVAFATVNHGLGVTPQIICVTPSVRSDGGTCWGMWNTRTTTNFVAYAINASAPTATGVQSTLCWIAIG